MHMHVQAHPSSTPIIHVNLDTCMHCTCIACVLVTCMIIALLSSYPACMRMHAWAGGRDVHIIIADAISIPILFLPNNTIFIHYRPYAKVEFLYQS